MLSTRDIKRKIKTVRNIQQICRAMKTVSSIKLRKAEERILAARPYADALQQMVLNLGGAGESNHPLLQVREVKRVGIVVISADKGLAGSFNANLIRESLRHARSFDHPIAVTIGRKISDVFRREGFDVQSVISPVGGTPEYRVFAALADEIGAQFVNGVVDQVDLVYSQFGGKVTTIQLLPIIPPEGDETNANFIFEPNPEAILAQIMPRYLRTVLYTAVLSSIAAEHAARVTAMSLATENADDLITQLTMDYNKSRQATITGELTDIVGSAEALR